MSQVLGSFRSSVDVAVETPHHAILVLGVTLVAFVVGFALGLIPIVGPMVSSILVTPLMLAAVLGSANAARRGESVVEGLKRGLGDAGTSLVGAFGLLYAGYLVVGFAIAIVAAVVFALTIGVSAGFDPSVGSMFGGVMGVVFLLLFLVVFVAVMLVGLVAQFVGPAAVVAGTGAVDSLKTSYRFFRRNTLGVLGFSAIVFGFVVLAYALMAAAFAVGYFAVSEMVGFALGGVVYLLAFGLVGAVLTIYQVEYFDAVADASVLPAPEEATRTGARNATADGTVTETTQSRDGSAFEFGDEDHADDGTDHVDEGTDHADAYDRDARE